MRPRHLQPRNKRLIRLSFCPSSSNPHVRFPSTGPRGGVASPKSDREVHGAAGTARTANGPRQRPHPTARRSWGPDVRRDHHTEVRLPVDHILVRRDAGALLTTAVQAVRLEASKHPLHTPSKLSKQTTIPTFRAASRPVARFQRVPGLGPRSWSPQEISSAYARVSTKTCTAFDRSGPTKREPYKFARLIPCKPRSVRKEMAAGGGSISSHLR